VDLGHGLSRRWAGEAESTSYCALLLKRREDTQSTGEYLEP
jgi:hypothetical protein